MSTRNMTLTAMLTALLCIVGPLTLPIGPVPLSLTTAALALAALLLGTGRATLCCGVYLLIGLVGLPVFSGFLAGTALLYLIGTVWYAWQTGTSAASAVTVCVLPFLPGDAVKLAAVLIGGNAIKTRLLRSGLLK